jgi:hypothetical protein
MRRLRPVPDLRVGDAETAEYLNHLNRKLLTRLQAGGEAYLSKAVIAGKFALRVCIVNFRSSMEDIEALLPLLVKLGRELDESLRPQDLRTVAD